MKPSRTYVLIPNFRTRLGKVVDIVTERWRSDGRWVIGERPESGAATFRHRSYPTMGAACASMGLTVAQVRKITREHTHKDKAAPVQIVRATTQDELLEAVVERRASRVIYDATHSTSIEQEIADLLRYQRPFGEMALVDLLVEWDAFCAAEDAPGYTRPSLHLRELRKQASQARARQARASGVHR